ncbi:MAG: hypothetical protein WCG47_09355 [Dermatophilaceae bacterium]
MTPPHTLTGHLAHRPTIPGVPRPVARVGQPPPLRGSTPYELHRFVIACRASALVLEREGHLQHAAHLRRLAAAADTQATQRQIRALAQRKVAA